MLAHGASANGDEGVERIGTEEGGDKDGAEDQDAAHGGGADLGQVGDRAVVADRLAPALFGADPVDEAAAHGDGDDHGGGHGERHAHRLVLNQVQQRILVRHVGVVEIEQVKHVSSLPRHPRGVTA